MKTFVGRCRKQQLDTDALDALIGQHAVVSTAERLFLEVAPSIYNGYVELLNHANHDDFDGLMGRTRSKPSAVVRPPLSARKNRERGDLARLRFVMVDEFQDFSQMFLDLTAALLHVSGAGVFCVGDDWQAINGFAGSDLKFFERFDEFFIKKPSQLPAQAQLPIGTQGRTSRERPGAPPTSGPTSTASSRSGREGLALPTGGLRPNCERGGPAPRRRLHTGGAPTGDCDAQRGRRHSRMSRAGNGLPWSAIGLVLAWFGWSCSSPGGRRSDVLRCRGWNYGRFDDPSLPRYNVARDVDYCSGAAIMLRRDLLDDIGGLDEQFAPAYYDDVDLAFTVRERGLRVVYEPHAVVVHHEGVSHGTDETTGIKRFQEINRGQDGREVGAAARRALPAGLRVRRGWRPGGRGTKGIIVFVDDHVPRPDEDSGSVRTFALLRTLRRRGWSVVFVPSTRATGDVWGRAAAGRGHRGLHRARDRSSSSSSSCAPAVARSSVPG